MSLRHTLALLGLSAVVGVVALTGAFAPVSPALRIEYGPQPTEFVQIREGTAFTVPPGKLFVLTAVGSSQNAQQSGFEPVQLTVNGQSEFDTNVPRTTDANMPSVQVVPGVLGFPSGSVVEVRQGAFVQDDARAWGYLSDHAVIASSSGRVGRVPVQPHPQDVVKIAGTAPYTVPAGKVLVITAIGAAPAAVNFTRVAIDGRDEVTAPYPGIAVTTNSMVPLPLGCSAHAGSVVTLATDGGSLQSALRAWGYLANE